MIYKKELNLEGKSVNVEQLISILSGSDNVTELKVVNYILKDIKAKKNYTINQILKLKNAIKDWKNQNTVLMAYYNSIKANKNVVYNALEKGVFDNHGFKYEIVEDFLKNAPYGIIKKFFANEKNYEYKIALSNVVCRNIDITSELLLGYNSIEDEKNMLSIEELLETVIKNNSINILENIKSPYVIKRLKDYENLFLDKIDFLDAINLCVKNEIISKDKIINYAKESRNIKNIILILAYIEDSITSYDLNLEEVIIYILNSDFDEKLKNELILKISSKMKYKIMIDNIEENIINAVVSDEEKNLH